MFWPFYLGAIVNWLWTIFQMHDYAAQLRLISDKVDTACIRLITPVVHSIMQMVPLTSQACPLLVRAAISTNIFSLTGRIILTHQLGVLAPPNNAHNIYFRLPTILSTEPNPEVIFPGAELPTRGRESMAPRGGFEPPCPLHSAGEHTHPLVNAVEGSHRVIGP